MTEMSASSAGGAWQDFWRDALDDLAVGLADTIAAEMPVDIASAPVADLLADRHELAAVLLRSFATGLRTPAGHGAAADGHHDGSDTDS